MLIGLKIDDLGWS